MKKLLCLLLALVMLTGCAAGPTETTGPVETTAPAADGEVLIRLSDEGVEFPENSGVHVANDIIYYEAGHGEDYGEGEAWEAHTPEEAAAHTVVHITRPGVYRLTGQLSLGQIAVDLGEDAKDDPTAAVVLILDNAEIICRVAPAVIFYNVYECGQPDAAAGAAVLLADGSNNRIVGSHVAKIYKPGTDEKLHKYDGAFYSRMSMKLDGAGKLRIEADNEGLDSEMHLTIDGGEIYIESGNDGINTNEDGVSVTTVNAGFLRVDVAGTTGEGDGIDSNGWLVINGGRVEAYACGTSADSGIDADMGIQINGGEVIATGNMLDRIEDGGQTYAVFSFAKAQEGLRYTLKDSYDSPVLEGQTSNAFTSLLLSSPRLTEGKYTLWSGETQFEGLAGIGGMGGGAFIGQLQPIERPDFPGKGDGDVEIPPQPTQPIVTHGTIQPPPQGDRPEDMPVAQFPQGGEGAMAVPPMPPEGENMPVPELPEGVEPPQEGKQPVIFTPIAGEMTTEFEIKAGGNHCMQVREAE